MYIIFNMLYVYRHWHSTYNTHSNHIKIQLITIFLPDVVARAYKPSNWEAEAGGSLIQGQLELLSEILSI